MTTPKVTENSYKTRIFAYLRRSTSKEEQKESLIQQEDGIDSIVRKLWLEKENIRYFAETYSGFENKKRKQWGELLKEIDRSKEPCIILTRDLSRLSRNPTDTQAIMDRLYGDNKRKHLIEKIIYLDYDATREITRETDKESLHKRFSGGYYDSLDTRRKSIGGIILKLEKGEFPYTAPKGLDNFVYKGQRILRQNDRMPFVKRAFEMKTEGKTHKEISKYLKEFGDIKIGDRDLTDRIFSNTIYIGQYTEKNTHIPFMNLQFSEGRPPITLVLWDRVQKCFWRKISQYGEGQEDHLLWEKIKSESGHLFSKYLAKWVYPTYKWKFKDPATGVCKNIHIAENRILEGFMDKIEEIIHIYFEEHCRRFIEERNNPEILQKALDEIKKLPSDKEPIIDVSQYSQKEIDGLFAWFWEDFQKLDWGKELQYFSALDFKNHILKTSPFLEGYKQDIQLKKLHIRKLELEKEDLEKEKIQYSRNASKLWYDVDMVKKSLQAIDDDIKRMDEQIWEFSSGWEIEEYLERLPAILWQIVELVQNSVQKRESEDMRDDLKRLLEITTVELTISNKKELKIKLFEVLDGLFSNNKCTLEALSPTNVRTFIENYDRIERIYGKLPHMKSVRDAGNEYGQVSSTSWSTASPSNIPCLDPGQHTPGRESVSIF